MFRYQIAVCVLTFLSLASASPILEDVTHGTSDDESPYTGDQDLLIQNLSYPFNSYVKRDNVAHYNALPDTGNLDPIQLSIAEKDARDCLDFYEAGQRRSGLYAIRPEGFRQRFAVYCDMEKDGGGWTVIQRRGNYGVPDNYFNRMWNEFKVGFGNLDQEFWLGNDKISALTLQGKYRLKIDVYDENKKSYSFSYGNFRVENEVELYRLTVGENAPSNPHDILARNNGNRFSTPDRDNAYPPNNCAVTYSCSWWFWDCSDSLLNCLKNSKKESTKFRVLVPEMAYLRYSQMKIRR